MTKVTRILPVVVNERCKHETDRYGFGCGKLRSLSVETV